MDLPSRLVGVLAAASIGGMLFAAHWRHANPPAPPTTWEIQRGTAHAFANPKTSIYLSEVPEEVITRAIVEPSTTYCPYSFLLACSPEPGPVLAQVQAPPCSPEGDLTAQLAEIRCWVVRFDETDPCGDQSPADCRAFKLAPGFRYQGEFRQRIDRAVAAPCRHIPTPPFVRSEDGRWMEVHYFQGSGAWQGRRRSFEDLLGCGQWQGERYERDGSFPFMVLLRETGSPRVVELAPPPP